MAEGCAAGRDPSVPGFACCSGSLIFAATPYGQQLARETEATETVQAAQSAQATAAAQAYLLAHPKPTATATSTPAPAATLVPTATSLPTATTTPRPAPTATPKPKPAPTATPRPAPTATPKPTCDTGGAPPNPWCYTLNNTGNVIYSPPSAFCDYFNCIQSFWTSTNGYVEECADGTYSHSGGRSGSCSYHGGNLQPLYQP